MIEIDTLTFRYESLLMDFTLHVPRGSFTAVLGPSGGGKSTLLSLIAGFEHPLSGLVQLNGVNMHGIAPAHRPVSMIFQDHNTFAHLDVWSNVAIGIAPALRPDASQRRRVAAALEQTGLAALQTRKPGEISGGERQRIAIARALLRDKPVLLLDEPFTALGPALRNDMLDLISHMQRERNITVLMVSHHPDDAMRAADHAAFLCNGRILAHRPVQDLLSATDIPELTDYLGKAPK